MHITLASQSPRRHDLLKEILADLGLKTTIDVRPAAVDETALPGETPVTLAYRLARAKAAVIVNPLMDGGGLKDGRGMPCPYVIIAADTIVVSNNQILGKPRDKNDAVKMLATLSGKIHEVMTGVAIAALQNNCITWHLDCVISRVTFRELTKKEIDDYVATAEPMDKAGAYAIQGGAQKFVAKLEGSFSNVVGLPKEWVGGVLRQVLSI